MHRLGASKAKSITFNSDGATWIWDRIDSILARDKVPSSVLRFKVLDVYHAAENLQKGIKSLGEQIGDVLTFPSLRTKLRDGQWIRRVINLRMKSNGTFWRVTKAERILVLRASILSGRWDEDRERVKRGMQKSRKLAMPPIRESNLSKTDARMAPMETQ